MASKLLHADVTDQIIGGFYGIHRTFGFGFLEVPYANALCVELERRGLHVKREVPVRLTYLGVEVGLYKIDILVNDVVVVEVKSTPRLTAAHEKQLMNYLKASNKEVGLLLNFGPEPEVVRRVLSCALNGPR
jgi:GxxExxY protein